MKRVVDYTIDFTFNGLMGLGFFFVLQFTFLYFTPYSWYFEYHSIEPIEVTNEYIQFESTLSNYQKGNMHWNDVLRCFDNNGRFSYYSQSETSAETIEVNKEPYKSLWPYREDLPNEGMCQLDSTITRKLQWGIEKKQFIQSPVFEI